MDVIENLTTEIRKMAIEEEQLRKEVQILKDELMIENFTLDTLKKDVECESLSNANTQKLLDSTKRHIESIKSISDTVRRSTLILFFLRKFIGKSDPTMIQQKERIAELQESYEKMLKHYEEGPTYRAILQEEKTERELNERIMEKRNQLMRLETEQEY